MKSVVITGINGFLGTHLKNRLEKDYEVIGLISPDNDREVQRLVKGINTYQSTEEGLNLLFAQNSIFAIIHCATVYESDSQDYSAIIETNLLLPVNLFGLASMNGVKKFLNVDSFFNSTAVKFSYLSKYSLSKKHAVEWLKELSKHSHCKYINLKLFHLYGGGDSERKFVSKVLFDLKQNIEVIELTPGEQRRDFIYIRDVVDAFALLINESTDIKKEMFAEFEIGTGVSHSVRDFVLCAKRVLNSKTKLNFGALPYRENELMDSQANIEPMLELGWSPNYNIESGIEDLISTGI